MSEPSSSVNPSATFWQLVSIISALATLAGLAIAIVSFRTESKKALTLYYFAPRPLLTFEGAASQSVEVIVAAQRVAAPSLLSGRLENTGTQPIEARDIEQPIRLRLESAIVINSNIVGVSQDAIHVAITHDSNSVAIQHGLLNPGDWIAFDVLMDGTPKGISATARISGVPSIALNRVSPGQARNRVSVIELPLPAMYFLLVIASLVAVLLVFGSIGLFVEVVGNLIKAWKGTDRQTGKEPDPKELAAVYLAAVKPSHPTNRVLLAALGGDDAKVDWIDDRSVLTEIINKQLPYGLLQAFDIPNAGQAAIQLNNDLRHGLIQRLADRIKDPERRSQLDAVEREPHSTTDMIEVWRKVSGDALPPRKFVRLGEFVFPVMLLLAGLSLIVFLGGAWRTLWSV